VNTSGEAAASAFDRLGFLIRNDLRNRFVGSSIGLAWAAVIPLLQLGLFAVVFGYILGARVPGLEGLGYTAFLALGMWPWFAFSEAVMRGSTALTENAALITKVEIAPWQLVAARTATSFMLHAAGYVLVLTVVWAAGIELDLRNFGYVLLGWAMLLPLAYALAVTMALLQLFIRDLQQLLPLALTAGLFLSPILYSLSMAPAGLRSWMALNPLAGIVSATRDSLLGQSAPSGLLTSLAGTVLFSVFAFWMYRRLRPHAEDFL
jgi:lipopolysaccharide transport system permease protein